MMTNFKKSLRYSRIIKNFLFASSFLFLQTLALHAYEKVGSPLPKVLYTIAEDRFSFAYNRPLEEGGGENSNININSPFRSPASDTCAVRTIDIILSNEEVEHLLHENTDTPTLQLSSTIEVSSYKEIPSFLHLSVHGYSTSFRSDLQFTKEEQDDHLFQETPLLYSQENVLTLPQLPQAETFLLCYVYPYYREVTRIDYENGYQQKTKEEQEVKILVTIPLKVTPV